MDPRSSRRQRTSDAADTEQLTREVDNIDLRSTRQHTNTDTEDIEPLARELNDEDRQSARRQHNIDSENDETTSQIPPVKKIQTFQILAGRIRSCPTY